MSSKLFILTTVSLSILARLSDGFSHSENEQDSNQYAIVNATLIDVSEGVALPARSILIHGKRIEEIHESAEWSPPESAQVIDAEGQFLIPGLWDMHIHWYLEESMPLFIANGILGVRIMAGFPLHHKWRESETKLFPHLEIASAIVDGPRPIWPGSLTAGVPAQGRDAVKLSIEAKSDFIKVYSLLPREVYFAIAEECADQSIPFAGHVPISVTAIEASDAGQRSFEHLTDLLLACSSEEAALRKLREEQGPSAQFGRDPRFNQRLIDSFDLDKANELSTHLYENETWQCPTLTVLRNLAFIEEDEIRKDPRLEYVPAPVVQNWKQSPLPQDEEARESGRAIYLKNVELVSVLHRAGVPILAGTDTLNPYCMPGFSLHDELERLVEAGLSQAEALRAATMNPARYLELSEETGAIEPGHRADLVLLRRNPLEKISHTRTIESVFFDGKYFNRAELDQILDSAKTR